MEPSRLWMDVVAFLETRLSDSGSVMERNFLFSGKENHQMKPGNMALVFTVRNTLLGSITSSADGSERGFSLQLHSSVVLVSLITAYAPILSSPGEAKDKLYHELAITIKGITEKELLTVHSRWLQRQSWCWSKVMAHLLGSFRHWEDERKQPRPSRVMPSSQTLFQERVLQ